MGSEMCIRDRDAELDLAIKTWPQIRAYLQQDADDAHSMDNSIEELMKIVGAVK